MSGSDDDEEIAGECPHHGTERCKIGLEVERPEHDIESEQVDEKIPHVFGQSQMIHVYDVGERGETLVCR